MHGRSSFLSERTGERLESFEACSGTVFPSPETEERLGLEIGSVPLRRSEESHGGRIGISPKSNQRRPTHIADRAVAWCIKRNPPVEAPIEGVSCTCIDPQCQSGAIAVADPQLSRRLNIEPAAAVLTMGSTSTKRLSRAANASGPGTMARIAAACKRRRGSLALI